MKIADSIAAKYKSLSLPLRASLWYIVCNFIQKGISVITVPVFTRLLSKEEYGNLSVYNSWYTILAIVVALGMYYGMHMQGIVKFREERDSFTSAILGLTTVLVLAWTAVYLLFHHFWNGLLTLNTPQMLAMLVNIWTSAVFALWANMERVEYRYRALIVITVVSSFLKPVVEILLVCNFEDKVTAKVIGTSAVELLVYFWLFIYKLKVGKVFYSGKVWVYALGFCIPLIPHYLSQTLLNQADRIMIRDMLGEGEAGIYSLAYSVSLVLSILVTALNQSVTPWLYGKIKAKKEKEMAGTVYMILLLMAALSLILIVLAPEIVYIFAPAEYREGICCIPPVAIGIYYTLCYSMFAAFAFYYEKKAKLVVATFSCAVINIVLNYLFIPIYGYVAAGYTTMVCYMLYALFHYIYMKAICKECCDKRYPYDGRILLLITGGFSVAGLLVALTYSYALIRYGIVILILLIMFIMRDKLKDLIMQLRTKGEDHG